jgi:hypothetical protein
MQHATTGNLSNSPLFPLSAKSKEEIYKPLGEAGGTHGNDKKISKPCFRCFTVSD